MLSVALRFALAAIFIGIWCLVAGVSLKLNRHQHKWILLAGIFLYTLDYSFLYAAQQHMISALLAVLSSSVIYFNVVLRRILLGIPMRLEVVIGATVGLVGIVLIFLPEFEAFSLQQGITFGLLFASASFLSAALGNVTSEKVLNSNVSVLQMNFWAMSYGVIITSTVAFLSGAKFVLPSASSYYVSLLYLSVFGSVIAFGAYMRLLKQIGSDKSAYVVLVYPIVALVISTFFENYQWSWLAVIGVITVLLGNAIAMGKLNNTLGLSN
jgi:drug/metabolite transporter (DMT)-like permease